jgi:hypothetical protein
MPPQQKRKTPKFACRAEVKRRPSGHAGLQQKLKPALQQWLAAFGGGPSNKAPASLLTRSSRVVLNALTQSIFFLIARRMIVLRTKRKWKQKNKQNVEPERREPNFVLSFIVKRKREK